MANLRLGVNSLQNIINDYHNIYQPNIDTLLNNLSNVDQCVRGTHWISKTKFVLGNKHQNHISKANKQKAINGITANVAQLTSCKNFEELFDAILQIMVSNNIVKGPCLWVYDIALRMGQTLKPKVEPINYVYLFRGAKVGAKQLGVTNIKKGYLVEKKYIPQPLNTLDSKYIESILCIYK